MRGSVTKKGNRWYIQIDAGYDDFGKRLRKTFSGYRTKREAENDLPTKLTEIQMGMVANQADTVEAVLFAWIEDKEKTVRPTTINNYRLIIRKHIVPQLGKVKLSKLTPMQVQTFYNRLFDNGKGMSAASVHAVHVVLHNALSRAMKWGMVVRNVTDVVDLPRQTRRPTKVWTAEEVATFLNSARQTEPRFWIAFYIALMTGMRRAEIAALRWTDIDFEKGHAYVHSTRTTVNGKVFEQNETKTKSSRRAIALSPSVLQELHSLRISQSEERLLYGQKYEDTGYILRRVNGQPYNPHSVNQAFYRARSAANVTEIRFHDLRHTHATLLLQQGIHPKIVSERLGHSNISLTMDTYSHVLPGMQQEAAAVLESMISSQKKLL